MKRTFGVVQRALCHALLSFTDLLTLLPVTCFPVIFLRPHKIADGRGTYFITHHQTVSHSLRSSNTNLLSVPRVHHTTFASRRFSVAAPSVWNSLPVDIRACSSPHTFFLKPTISIRPSVPPSGSHKCLRFGLWSTLRTLNDLFTYLLT